jgi:LPS sulfotransferase NodH
MNFLSRVRSAARVLLRGEQTREQVELPAITPEEVAEVRRFFPMDKFFIFGHARSGTTLLARLVRLHPEVHCNWQAHFFTRRPFLKSLVDGAETREWLRRRSNRWNGGRDLAPLVLRAAADFILERDACKVGKRIVGDKSPSSLIHGQAVRDMHAVYPDVRLIYIVRDGRDVLVSDRFRTFVEESRYLTRDDRRIIEALRTDPGPFTNGARSIFTDTWLRRSAQGWVTNLTETETEGRRLYGERYIQLRYEDLLTHPFDELTKLWSFLGVDADPALESAIRVELASNPDEEWQSQRNGSIASFLPKGQAGNWRSLFTAHDRALFKEVAGEILMKWGYERDSNW